MKSVAIILLVYALFLLGPCSAAQASGAKLVLRRGWEVQSSAKVAQNGAVISTTHFQAHGWYPAQVPTTVLAALVHDGLYPHPYFGMNLRRIPGSGYLASWALAGDHYPPAINFSNQPMPTDSPFKPAWWYRTTFRVPSAWLRKAIWLHFDGLNYRADIWLNGHLVAGKERVVGTWRIFRFNVTGWVRLHEANSLAVEVFPPHADDLGITWVDWNPAPPDKDMGIWRPVYLSATGPVTILRAQVVTHFDLPSLDVAHLTVRATVKNASGRPVSGILEGSIGKVKLRKEIHLRSNGSLKIIFTPREFPQLNLQHPQLWWPLNAGPQNLYTLDLAFDAGGAISDRLQVRFGVRQVTSYLNRGGNIVFMVNGKRILIRGAGWAPDMMLRENPEKMAAELQYVRDAHLNALRLEGKIETDYFFNLCDRYGILVMAGWCCCAHWERWSTWKPEDYRVAAASLRDQIRRLRNHPCLLTWLTGSDMAPPARVGQIYAKVLRQEHWPNPYQTSSDATHTPGTGPTGYKGHGEGHFGPYNWEPPDYWLLDHKYGGAWGFNTETTPDPAVPPLASLKLFLPANKLWPINKYWTFHAGAEEERTLKVFTKAMNARYGAAKNVSDYAEKAQVMAYEGERAMFEGFGRNKYVATGVIQWMLNNAWPSLIYHLFDYYLRPGGGYYGAKKACEPLHVQYSYDDRSIVVVNSFYRPWDHLTVKASVYNLELRLRFRKTAVVRVAPDSSTRVFVIPEIAGLTTTYFVRLTMRDSRGQLRSSNFYWLSTKPDVLDWAKSKGHGTPQIAYADFRALESLPKIRLALSSSTEKQAHNLLLTRVTLKNPSSTLAFFVHLRILKGRGRAELLPVFWQDNDLELMPGEEQEITGTYASKDLGGMKPVVAVDGWNVAPATVTP
ncbi:MAG: glycosyl hydrolase 2 galactose-binding domain-containing protein [Terriglobia bacterium]